VPNVPFPEEPVGEWTICRPYTAPGLFCYRVDQALSLLKFPDFGGGDLDATQRSEALQRAIAYQKPLAALVIFLNVVALEDFIRDLGARLADDHQYLASYFPNVSQLRKKPFEPDPNRPFLRLDSDPAKLLDPVDVNKLYQRCLGVEPIPSSEHSKLRDLALLRHTVAHHGAVIRSVDVQRFQHYTVQAGHIINPPVAFVRDVCTYLYGIGRTFEESVKDRIFSKVIPTLGPSWWEQRPPPLLDLIELFNYFGKLVTSNGPVGTPPPGTEMKRQMRDEDVRVGEELIRLCIDELRNIYT
jgi:hypothetical protein